MTYSIVVFLRDVKLSFLNENVAERVIVLVRQLLAQCRPQLRLRRLFRRLNRINRRHRRAHRGEVGFEVMVRHAALGTHLNQRGCERRERLPR